MEYTDYKNMMVAYRGQIQKIREKMSLLDEKFFDSVKADLENRGIVNGTAIWVNHQPVFFRNINRKGNLLYISVSPELTDGMPSKKYRHQFISKAEDIKKRTV